MTQRDKDVLRFIEKYKAITTQQARHIFFNGCEKSTIRRLNQLEDLKIIEGYYVGKNKLYKFPEERKLTQHDVLILNLYSWIYKNGGEVIDFIITPHFLNNMLIPDGLVKFKIPYAGNKYTVFVLLEIDYTHYTDNIKMNTLYEKLYREKVLSEYCGQAEFPFIVVSRPTPGIRYSSNNFEVIYTDLEFTNLTKLMFE